MPILFKVTEEGRERAVRIPDGQEKIRIGRGETCDIRLDELRASREHCEIVRIPAGWKLVDLESRNGTKVNGLGVNTHLLRPDDKVEIGRSQIVFLGAEGAAPRAPVPRPVSAPRAESSQPPLRGASAPLRPVPAEIPEPVGGTVFMSRPAPAPERVRGGVGRILTLGAAAAALLAAVGIGASVWSGWQQRQEEEAIWRRARDAEDAAGPPGSAGRTAGLRAARDLYRKLSKTYPGSPQRAAAESAEERLDREVSAGDTVEKRIAAIEGDRKALAPTRTRISDWRGRAQALLAETKEPETVARLRDMLAVLDAQSAKLDEEDVAAAEGLVAADESRKEFGAALARLAPLASRDPPLPAALSARVAAVRKRVTDAAEASLQNDVLAEADLLIEQEKYAEARAVLERAALRYRGVEKCEVAAAIKLHVVNICLSGTMNRREAESYFKEREDVLKTAVEAEQATRERRFADAIGIYKKIVEASDLRDVKVEFERKIEDLRVQEALWTRLRRDSAAGALASKTLAIGSGAGAARATVSGATDDAVILSVSGGTVRKKWAALTEDELLALLGLAAGPGDDQVALALFAHVAGRAEEAERILCALCEREPVRGADLHLLVSRLRKEPLPSGGYVLHGGRFVSAAEKRRLEASEALEALVERVRKARRADLPGAVAALKGQPGGLEQAVAELKARVVRHREALEADVGFLRDENEPVRKLRAELDDRRKLALTYIWDVSKYPDKKTADPGFYSKAQQEVDERVLAVKKSWESPILTTRVIPPRAAETAREMKEAVDLLASLDPAVKPSEHLTHDPDYLAAFAGKRLSVQDLATKLVEERLHAYNARILEQNEREKWLATDVERKQVAITNEYRRTMAFGPARGEGTGEPRLDVYLTAVRVDDRLVLCARGHSERMASGNEEFDHFEKKDPKRHSPNDRAALAGYVGGNISENIHWGHGDPGSAHVSWLHSAGHHRNILNPQWRVLGSGVSGVYWTQNFGSVLQEPKAASAPAGGKG